MNRREAGRENTTPEGAGHDHGAGDHEHAGDQGNAAARDGGGGLSPYLFLGAGVVVATAATAGLAVLRNKGRTPGA